MADVTISQLPDLAVTGTNHLVHTNGTTTGKATVNTLRTALSIPAAQIQSDWTQTNSAALDFIKNKPSTGLSIRQILFFTSNSSVGMTSAATGVATGLQGVITPSSTSSRIFALVRQAITSGTAYETTRPAAIWLTRNGATVAGSSTQAIINVQSQRSAVFWSNYTTFHVVDSPNTTAALTYQVRVRSLNGNNGSADPSSYMTLVEIG